MNINGVFPADLKTYLTDSLQKGLAFNISRSAADFCNNHIGIGLFAYAVNKLLNFIGYMRDNLHRLPQILSPTLFIKHIPVNLACSKVRKFIKVLIDKSFVMTEVKVGFRTVLGYKNLAVLIGAHCAGVYINIRVKLLRRNL